MNKFSHSKIMLIEDNEIDTFIAEKILKSVGYKGEIVRLRSVLAGLNFLDELLKENESIPSLIFLDIVLPIYDGFYFLEKISSLLINTGFTSEIVILTASCDPDQKTNLLNSNWVTAYFDKPLTHDIALALLSSKYQLNNIKTLMAPKE